jgi:signal-transduction protein with cAMP-binding, CBS, and nucleotidyltransferase domain
MSEPPSVTATVGEIMTERLETIKVINTAQEAAIKMKEKNVSSLAVLHEDGSAAGIVTERDFVRRLCTTEKSSSKVKIQEMISSPVKTISPDTSVGEAADIMVRNRIRHLLVIDQDSKPVGIVSETNIVAYVRRNSEIMLQADREVLEVLEKEGRFYF